jgi:hypothetical protein
MSRQLTEQAVSVNNFFAGVLGLTFPSLLRAMGQTGACKHD